MLYLSDLLIEYHDMNTFEELVKLVKQQAQSRTGERFFRMDVRPPYPDTPENWEDRLEAAFS
ncbi:MAG: sulfur relay protein DsrC [Thiomargarita sp.]|nr:sulfur relay protein DsrC [Thiomargarita sp.]